MTETSTSPPGRASSSSLPLPTLARCLLTVVAISLATGGAILVNRLHVRDVEVPFFLFALALTAWYGGVGPAVLGLVLALFSFDYFFIEPLYSLSVNSLDVPYFFIFGAFALLVTWFSTIRKRVEQDLRLARDRLQVEVTERTQQASLLNLSHDSIFVRDMRFVITYWNRGAQELYGWTAEEAIGKPSQDLLATEFPIPQDEILAKLLATGRWEGELKRTKADGVPVVVASRWSLRRDQRGQPTAILETSNDISERKRREI